MRKRRDCGERALLTRAQILDLPALNVPTDAVEFRLQLMCGGQRGRGGGRGGCVGFGRCGCRLRVYACVCVCDVRGKIREVAGERWVCFQNEIIESMQPPRYMWVSQPSISAMHGAIVIYGEKTHE